jgi:hypothetical protein
LERFPIRPLDLDDDDWYSAFWPGSRAWFPTSRMSRQVTALDNAERFQSGLSDDFVDGRPIL